MYPRSAIWSKSIWTQFTTLELQQHSPIFWFLSRSFVQEELTNNDAYINR